MTGGSGATGSSASRPVGLAAFDVGGQRAGVTDPRALAERLRLVEDELSSAQAQLDEKTRAYDEQAEHTDTLMAESEKLRLAARALQRRAQVVAFEHERLAYGLVRVGAGHVIDSGRVLRLTPVNHGQFTRGRPYLAGDCVWEDEPSKLYVATRHVMRGGRRPSASRAWRSLWPDERTTDIEQPYYEEGFPHEHPSVNGWAIRQTNVWVDRDWRAWGLEELSREHLLGVIDWLHRKAAGMYAGEAYQARAWKPCPVNSYPDCAEWLADTPLYNALVAERARRRVRRSRHRSMPFLQLP